MNLNIYKDIAKQLRLQVSEVKHIDLFNQQYDRGEKEHPFGIPAVFVEYVATAWTAGGNNAQEGDSAVRIHVVMDNYGDTANIDQFEEAVQTEKLKHYEVARKVHQALQGFIPCCGTELQRVGTEYDHDHDQILVEVITYGFSEADTSADRYSNYIEVTPGLKVTGDIKTEVEEV